MKAELKKIACTFLKVYILSIIFITGICLFIGKIYIIPFSILPPIVMVSYLNKKTYQCLRKVSIAYQENFNIDCAVIAYEEALEDKFVVRKNGILYNYLSLLLSTCQYDKIVEVYKKNRKIAKGIFAWAIFDRYIWQLSVLIKGKAEYRSKLLKMKFSKYYKVQGKLDGIKAARREFDKTIEILKLYEIGEYQNALELIEQKEAEFPWDQLYFHSLKERCRYQLGQEYSLPEQEQTKYLFVKQWDELVRTGEEYYEEQAVEIISMIKKDRAISYMKFWIICIIDYIVLGFCVFLILL